MNYLQPTNSAPRLRCWIKRASILAAAIAGVASLPTSVHAGVSSFPIATPASLNPGDHFYVVFLTNSTGTGLSADVNSYDTIAASDGSSLSYHGLPVAFKALVSTIDNPATGPNDPVNALDRFDPASGIGIYLVDGTKVANDGAGLWSSTLLHEINLTPTGTTLSTDVWTGTDSSGHASTSAAPALGTTQALGNGGFTAAGSSTATGAGWVESGWSGGNKTAHFYAFSTELTAVPEPATLSFLGLGGIMLLRRRRAAE